MKNQSVPATFFNVVVLLLLVAAYRYVSPTTNDPIARIGTLNGGEIAANIFHDFKELNASRGVEVCTVTSFDMTYVSPNVDPVGVINKAQDFNERVLQLVAAARSLDCYYFDDVMVKCPGDKEERKVNALVFKIK
jgi:hypothetical protein